MDFEKTNFVSAYRALKKQDTEHRKLIKKLQLENKELQRKVDNMSDCDVTQMGELMAREMTYDDMKILIILRGLQGSGKSSVAKLFNTKAICSADDYFMRGGKYKWYGAGLYQAHMWCIRKCRRFMKKQADVIVIDNTSVKARDLKPYTDLARQFGYIVHSIIVENRHGGVNTHNVPEETLEKLRTKFDIKL